MRIIVSCLGCFVLCVSGKFAFAHRGRQTFQNECESYLSSEEGKIWAGEEQRFLSGAGPVKRPVRIKGKKLSQLQTLALDLPDLPGEDIFPEDLEVLINPLLEHLQVTTFCDGRPVGHVVLDWKRVRLGFLHFNFNQAELVYPVTSRIRKVTYYLFLRKQGSVTLGYGFPSQFDHRRGDYPPAGCLKNFGLQIFVVRECPARIGEANDLLFPQPGTYPDSKNLCLTELMNIHMSRERR